MRSTSWRPARAILVATALCVYACATSPTGRQQLTLFPDSVMANLGNEAFADIKSRTPEVDDAFVRAYVSCVADGILRRLPSEHQRYAWETVVFRDESPNAFALPGGKIGVNSGMLDVAEDQHQLAVVIGHEIAHVLANHANERISSSYATQAGLDIISGALGSSPERNKIMGALGVGAKYGMMLPYNRQREAEADVIGLDLMVDAGFNPFASVQLWMNMADASPGRTPEFMSTHPSHDTRIEGLAHRATQIEPRFEAARRAGYVPDCDRIRPQ